MIDFFSEGVEFEISHQSELISWIDETVSRYNRRIDQINFIFVSDEHLLSINREHLDHDTYTDIITFPLHGPGLEIMGDIFISVDRVQENANDFGIEFRDELHRVMIHGVLHMAGEDDKGEDAKLAMRKAEDLALSLRKF
ncbi:MAG: rRNA maturation RNase YbeY [Bacteroidota bacterium]